MRKLFVILLSLCLMFGLAACAGAERIADIEGLK